MQDEGNTSTYHLIQSNQMDILNVALLMIVFIKKENSCIFTNRMKSEIGTVVQYESRNKELILSADAYRHTNLILTRFVSHSFCLKEIYRRM